MGRVYLYKRVILYYMEVLKQRVELAVVITAGGVGRGLSIAYTGDITDQNRERYNLKYYMGLVDELKSVEFQGNAELIITIKDMAGVLHPSAARLLVRSIRDKYPDLPIQVHTHDTSGTGVASAIAAIEEGADGVDAAIDSMSGVTSQPSLGALVRIYKNTPKVTGEFSSFFHNSTFFAVLSMSGGVSEVSISEGDPNKNGFQRFLYQKGTLIRTGIY
ncbi:hypothetical protein COOONC_02541 [Cooperia oncophora]